MVGVGGIDGAGPFHRMVVPDGNQHQVGLFGSLWHMAGDHRHVPERPEQPDMMLIAVGGDHPMERPSPIDAADPDHAIVAALQPEISLRFRSMVNKCWSSQGA